MKKTFRKGELVTVNKGFKETYNDCVLDNVILEVIETDSSDGCITCRTIKGCEQILYLYSIHSYRDLYKQDKHKWSLNFIERISKVEDTKDIKDFVNLITL